MCGIVGIFGVENAANYAYLALYALQHRGQESAGITSFDNGYIYHHVDMGKVRDVFTSDVLLSLKGRTAVGHTRYSTAGDSSLKNAQPFHKSGIAIAHNGNITNIHSSNADMSDTKLLLERLLEVPEPDLRYKVYTAIQGLEGAYSLIVANNSQLIALRDPWGYRPLVMGRLQGGYVFASETCALDLLEATNIEEIAPGNMVHIRNEGEVQFYDMFPEKPQSEACVFELVYFSRPDSYIFGQNVYRTRKKLGKQLAKEHPVQADMIIPVPDSGVPAALGYAEEAQIPFELGIIRNHYIGRTFIEPEQSIRNFGVKLKLNPNRDLLEGKNIVLIDDSLVRGTTMKKLISILRQNGGVQKVHVRISSPPVIHPCIYGIDTPTKDELISTRFSLEEITRQIGADSLQYISYDGMMNVVSEGRDTPKNFCGLCFRGK